MAKIIDIASSYGKFFAASRETQVAVAAIISCVFVCAPASYCYSRASIFMKGWIPHWPQMQTESRSWFRLARSAR